MKKLTHKSLSTIALLALGSACAGTALATCDLTVSVNSELQLASQLSWSGCSKSGQGLQAALDQIDASGGGSLKLTGPGSILVDGSDALHVRSNTMVFGDPARQPYGMTLVGDVSTINGVVQNYRANLPIFHTAHTNNVTFWNLNFQSAAGKAQDAAAIFIAQSTNTVVSYVRIANARKSAIGIINSTYPKVQYASVYMERKSEQAPADFNLEGGAAIWVKDSVNVTLDSNEIFSKPYYDAGPPTALQYADPRSFGNVNAAPTMDQIAVYGGKNIRIQHNRLYYGNTAGIYVSCSNSSVGGTVCSNAQDYPLNVTIWDNEVKFFRQHGIDVAFAKCELDATTNNCFPNTHAINTNLVDQVDFAPLSLASSEKFEVRFNTLKGGALNPWATPWEYGAILLSAAQSNTVSNNDLYGGVAHFGISFCDASANPYCHGTNSNNLVQNNNIWHGSIGHVGGCFNGASCPNTVINNTNF